MERIWHHGMYEDRIGLSWLAFLFLHWRTHSGLGHKTCMVACGVAGGELGLFEVDFGGIEDSRDEKESI